MCGILGVQFCKNPETIASLSYSMLSHLQHRGQDSAGIAITPVDPNADVLLYKKPGTLDRVFMDAYFQSKKWHGWTAVAQVRYSTSGVDFHDPRSVQQATLASQPFVINFRGENAFMSYNGNLTPLCTDELHQKLYERNFEENWKERSARVDTELIAKAIEFSKKETFLEAILDECSKFRGAFSFVFMYRGIIFAIRDKWGFRPLEYGIHPNGHIIASEDNIFDHLKFPGIKKIRSIEPGECLILSKEGDEIKTRSIIWAKEDSNYCQFEDVYFKRFDSMTKGVRVASLRKALGKKLAQECPPPPNIDIVMGVPDSGCDGAIGYAEETGIPYKQEGLRRLHGTGRTFIEPVHFLRKEGVEMKFTVIPEEIQGKRIIIIDDSIVRGTVAARIVYLLKNAGALEVHSRVTSPPVKFGCWYGFDTYRIESELIAKDTPEIKEIVRKINEEIQIRYGCSFILDSLDYLSLEGMESTWKEAGLTEKRCNACWTGNYPVQ